MIDADLYGVDQMSQAAIAALRESKGSIINTSSASGPGGDWNHSLYCAAKGAVTNVTRALAMDEARAGVGLDALWSSLRQQVYLGSETFVERMQRHLPDRDLRKAPRVQRHGPPGPLPELAAKFSRDQAMVQGYRSGDSTMKQIGAYFSVHYATVSRAIRRQEKRGSISDCKT